MSHLSRSLLTTLLGRSAADFARPGAVGLLSYSECPRLGL